MNVKEESGDDRRNLVLTAPTPPRMMRRMEIRSKIWLSENNSTKDNEACPQPFVKMVQGALLLL